MSARRVRFSTLLWPSLYSYRRITILAIVAVLLILAIFLTLRAAFGVNPALTARLNERATSALQVKLAGVETWRWRQNFTCANGLPDCLRLTLRFGSTPGDDSHQSINIMAPPACAICHAEQLAQQRFVVASFPDIPIRPANQFAAYAIVAALLSAFAYAFTRLTLRRRRERAAGICVAALRVKDGAPPNVQRWISQALKSPFSAYFVESEGDRVRWITTAEKFSLWLKAEAQSLEQHAPFVNLVALHGNLTQVPILPVELLRYAYRFLTLKEAPSYLLHQDLITNKGENAINRRRLVLKNKSGASLIFVVWEPD